MPIFGKVRSGDSSISKVTISHCEPVRILIQSTKVPMTIIRRILKTAWNEFIYGGHLQCLGVTGIAYISSFILRLEASWEFLVLSYLIFYPIYIHDRFRGVKMDEATNPDRTKHFKRYLSIMPKLMIASMVMLVALLIHIGNSILSLFSLIMLLLGILYPVYFKDLTKKIIAFKNFYVSSFFAAIVVIPIIFHNHDLDPTAKAGSIILILFVFMKTLLMQILLDCKDVEGDKPLGLLTVPVMLGKDRTLRLLKIASLSISLVVLIPAVILLPQFPIEMIVLLLVVPLNLYTYNLSKKEDHMGYVIGSGEFVLWFALIFVTKSMI